MPLWENVLRYKKQFEFVVILNKYRRLVLFDYNMYIIKQTEYNIKKIYRFKYTEEIYRFLNNWYLDINYFKCI